MRQEPTSLSSSPSSSSRAPGPGRAVALLRALRAPHLPPDALLG